MRLIKNQDIQMANKTPSKGNQGKYHIREKWIKTDYLGYEAASEYLASEILQHSNIKNYVSYSIEKIQIENKNGLLRKANACVSHNFLSPHAEIVTLDKFLKQKLNTTFEQEVKGKSTKDAIEHIVNLVEENTNITNFGQYLTSMFEFDAFILNEDRHVQNIIFINENETYTPGPIFDNGAAFLSDITQEYPLEEKTNHLIPYVKAKPFDSSFSKQVEACHELYGKQLTIEKIDISKQINIIKNYYGERIANRIQHIYDIQMQKNKDFLQITTPTDEKDSLYTEKEMLQEIKEYITNGGSIVLKSVPEEFVNPIKVALMEEKVPFIAIRDKNNICNIFTKDIDTKAFLKIQKEVFSTQRPSILKPRIDDFNKIIEEHEFC